MQLGALTKHTTNDDSCVLSAKHLNSIQAEMRSDFAYRFINQDSMQDSRYYEHIIFEDKCIPTRSGSTHDYFNGLIWLQFEKCKTLLNEIHWHEISKNGHRQRSAVRDKATHFDECGMVLVSDIPELKTRLAAHDWHWLFIEKRSCWFKAKNGIVPLHFGHANLELLCQPFIGQTAKALVIEDADLLEKASHVVSNPNELHTFKAIDNSVAQYLKTHSIMHLKKPFLPLPILGIPTWHFAVQDEEFYGNKYYFMPHKSARA